MNRAMDYVELHVHSCFSLLDGASTPELLLDRAAELGMAALALTDHNGVYAAVRFTLAAEERGIHPVIGAELTLEDGRHLVLLAETQQGYRNLCYLISRAQLEHSKGTAKLSWEHLTGHTAGLIALTGCRQGVVAAPLLEGDQRRAQRSLEELDDLFGKDHLYVEIEHHLHPDSNVLVEDLVALARRAHLPIVATNNVHYARREGYKLQHVLASIRRNEPLTVCRNHLYPNSEYYLKAGAELSPLFKSFPEALGNTVEIANRCHITLDFRSVAIPPTTLDGDPDRILETLCVAALPQRYSSNLDEAKSQLRHELEIIRQTRLAGYFIMVWDIVHYAREQGIQVRGRGSAANSIVAYLLGITNVDPLAHNLLFERFLSAETRVMPDIDLDFCSRRREEVIQYVYRKYGERHVGMVCNYVTYQARLAIRDVGKALNLPDALADRLAKGEGRWGVPIHGLETFHVAPSLWKEYQDLCKAIQGYPRHLSIHVGGLCITATPLDEIVPLERATMPDRVVIQWDKDSVEDAGLIKLDLLSLRTLSAIDESLSLIRKHYGEHIDLDSLPLDDPDVYDQLCRADTIGAFQVESRAQQQALFQMQPKVFSDLIIEIALIRPGPLQGNMVHPFFRRRQGLEPVNYMHPFLKEILEETLGVVIFQEQVIRLAMAMAGFSAGEADLLRRAMSRHRAEEEMMRFRDRFVSGATARGVDQAVAEEVFAKLAGFASYGFCKSHAAAFAKTAYDTLWLRAHYPAAYYCALLNNQPMGFYAPRVIVGDAQRHGIEVRPVHINRSQEICLLEGSSEGTQAIRLGFLYIDGLGHEGSMRIVSARPHNGYADLADLCRRTRLPRSLIEKIILAGALDDFEQDRRKLLWDLARQRYREDELNLPVALEGIPLEPMSSAEKLAYEYGLMGFSAQGHLMELFREQLDQAQIGTSHDLAQARDGDHLKIAGIVAVRQQPPTAKGFVFYTLEDEWGLMNVIVRPRVFRVQRDVWVTSSALIVQGVVQRAQGQVNLIAERAWRLS